MLSPQDFKYSDHTMATVWIVTSLLIFLQGHVTGREYCSYLVTGNLWPYTDNKFCEYGCCEKDCCTYNDYLATSKRKTWTLIGAAVGVVVMLMVLTTAACCVYRRRHPRIVTQGFSGNMDNAIPVTLSNHI
ncbi:uncharacterized protein LOC112571624 [Pomacea canaliculata]|uniref:uncharacterized protein LOC112571624 n=1 Tax=Pomacea canaliculata TaxID=400727 RepID=UPI000D73E2FE|nr:uncharacterized protein LOC112571624 [Pomacea canaliculata]